MKYRSFGPLLLCGLVLVGFRANSQTQTPSNARQPGRISQNELNQLAKNLSANGLQQYVYRLDTLGAKGAAKMDKPRIVRGLFMMRQPAFMKPLPNGFFDDGIGDLVYFGKINRDGKTNVNYALTFAASGDVIAAFDINNDGLADGILGRDSVGTSWSLNNKSLGALQECFESRAFGEVVLCVRGRITRQPAGGRGRTDARSGAGTGSTGSDADAPDSLGSIIDDLSKPDCNTTPDPGALVRDPIKDEIVALYNERDELKARANAERARHNEAAAGHLDYAAANSLQAAVNLHRSTMPGLSSSEHESERAAYQNRLRARDEAVQSARDAGANTSGLRLREPMMVRPPTMTAPRPRLPGGGARRPIGPDGENEDPRCQGKRTQIKQGLWFMSREYCPDRNFLDCWQRAQDAVSEATDGLCHLEPGPAGGQMLVCARPTDEQNKDATQPPPPEPVPGPADEPLGRFNLSPGVKLNYTYISTTQLGAMLGVLCRVDGCGPM